MGTVDITTGVQMKQRESNVDEAEKGEGRKTLQQRGFNEPWGKSGEAIIARREKNTEFKMVWRLCWSL